MNETNRLIGDILWDLDDLDEIDPSAMNHAIVEISIEDRLDQLRDLLAQVFPDGTPQERRNQWPLSTATHIGNHRIEFLCSVPTESLETTWEAHWHQNVSVPTYTHKNPAQSRGMFISKVKKTIHDINKIGGWLSWVYREICKSSVEVIRISLHPDQWMKDTGAAFRAANDLRLMHADWADVGDIIVQQFPWRCGMTNGSFICSIFHLGRQIGSIGVQKKGDHWRYGGQIDLNLVHPVFCNTTLKFKHEVAITTCPTSDEAVKRAEKLYACKTLEWITKHSDNRELHVS